MDLFKYKITSIWHTHLERYNRNTTLTDIYIIGTQLQF